MPGGAGGGRFTAASSVTEAATASSRSPAGGGGDFGEVAVFGRIIWMPMLLTLIPPHPLLRGEASGQTSKLRNGVA